jgi:UTP-glucose-1-phosphate uridylyltransferase
MVENQILMMRLWIWLWLDFIASLMKTEQVSAYYTNGRSHDCGSKLVYMMANVEYVLRHPELGEFKNFLKSTSLSTEIDFCKFIVV